MYLDIQGKSVKEGHFVSLLPSLQKVKTKKPNLDSAGLITLMIVTPTDKL